MKKHSKLKTINIILFFDLLLLGFTGIFARLIPYDIYRIIHPAAGYSFLVLAVIHLYLNRGWIKNNIFS